MGKYGRAIASLLVKLISDRDGNRAV